jgi:hypothetical protein
MHSSSSHFERIRAVSEAAGTNSLPEIDDQVKLHNNPEFCYLLWARNTAFGE